jgi:pimeloyl-ACP methyl ester carboxylesterase
MTPVAFLTSRAARALPLLTCAALVGACDETQDASTADPMPGEPTVVFVYGAWHTPDQWDAVGAELDARGIRWTTVDLPSAGPDTRERLNADGTTATVLSSLPGDVAETVAVIEAQPGPVFLVGHSYGGFVLNQAGHHPKVQHLTYLCAFAPNVGETLVDLAVGSPPPLILEALRESPDRLFLTIDPLLAADVFYADLPEDAQQAAVDKLVPNVSFIFDQPSGHPAWRERDTTYVVCSDDRAISPEREREMGERAGGDVIELTSSHSPFLSQPAIVADLLRDAVDRL